MKEKRKAQKEFLKLFTKEELLEVLVEIFRFERIANDMCRVLYERKSKKLLDEMDRNVQRNSNCKTLMEMAEMHNEFENLDRQLDRLNAKFEKLQGR